MKIIKKILWIVISILMGIIKTSLESLGGFGKRKTTNRVSELSKEALKDCQVSQEYSDDELYEIFLD